MEEARPRAQRRSDSLLPEAEAGTSPMNGDRRAPRRALIVTTESSTLRLCREVLERSEFAVDAVDSGIAALIAVRAGVPDLVLVDSQLRDVPGREAIEWLRSNPALRSTPIIVLTTNAEDETEFGAPHPGRALRKPVSPLAFQRTIEEALK